MTEKKILYVHGLASGKESRSAQPSSLSSTSSYGILWLSWML